MTPAGIRPTNLMSRMKGKKTHTHTHTPSGQSRVYRVTLLRTDGVHCLPRVRRHRASKPQGSSERVLPWQVHHGPINISLSFPHPHNMWYEVGMLVSAVCVANQLLYDGERTSTSPLAYYVLRSTVYSTYHVAHEDLVSRKRFDPPVPH